MTPAMPSEHSDLLATALKVARGLRLRPERHLLKVDLDVIRHQIGSQLLQLLEGAHRRPSAALWLHAAHSDGFPHGLALRRAERTLAAIDEAALRVSFVVDEGDALQRDVLPVGAVHQSREERAQRAAAHVQPAVHHAGAALSAEQPPILQRLAGSLAFSQRVESIRWVRCLTHQVLPADHLEAGLVHPARPVHRGGVSARAPRAVAVSHQLDVAARVHLEGDSSAVATPSQHR
mmetsp:Transcript_33855/g.84364  ORF Transcript_33855/g.84364 Transcript_33855/m.84364 type:complete len:234 (-) Transcript_33855:137-838(-)